MQDKWNVRNNNKKGYLKIYIAVNIKSKKIISMKVTDEHVHDSKALPILVNDVIKSNNITTISKVFADDGAYDSNDIFRCLMDNGILPFIKVRKRMLKLDGKKETPLETFQFWLRKRIYKNGKIVLDMNKDGLQKPYFLV